MLNGFKEYFSSSLTKNLEKYKKMKPNSVINSIGNLGRFDTYKDEKDNNILHIAIQENWIPVVHMLLRIQNPKIDLNLQNKYGRTPLMYAVLNKNKVITELLLQKSNININLQDIEGYTALMFAIIMKNQKLSEEILKKSDINVNLQNVSI